MSFQFNHELMTIPKIDFQSYLLPKEKFPPGSIFSENDGHKTVKIAPLTSYGDSWYFLNHMHNWGNLFMYQNLYGRSQKDKDTNQLVQETVLGPNTLSSLQATISQFSTDYQDLKKEIQKLTSITQGILDNIKVQAQAITFNPPPLVDRIISLEQNQKEILSQLQRLSQALLPPAPKMPIPTGSSSTPTRTPR